MHAFTRGTKMRVAQRAPVRAKMLGALGFGHTALHEQRRDGLGFLMPAVLASRRRKRRGRVRWTRLQGRPRFVIADSRPLLSMNRLMRDPRPMARFRLTCSSPIGVKAIRDRDRNPTLEHPLDLDQQLFFVGRAER